MLPLVYATLRASSTVKNLVGTKIYRHGYAPENTVAPYVTWFVVSGLPYDNVSDSPTGDRYTVQIDCWSDTDSGAESLAKAVRDSLDAGKITNTVIINNREPDTHLFRIGLQADFINPR